MRLRKRRGQEGMALGTVLILTGLVLLSFMTLANLSIAATRLTSNGRDKAISLSLAEAGIDRAVAEIKENNNYTGTGGLEIAIPGGTYQVTVTPVPDSDNLKDVYSIGKTVNGKTRTVRARVNISGLALGNGAMISRGDVEITGSVLVRVVDQAGIAYGTPQKVADVRANGDITGGGAAFVDGRIAAAGTVSLGSMTATAGAKSGASQVAFPTQSTINEWTQQWISGAQAGGTISGINNDTFKALGTNTITINGPKYINGDINLDGGKVTLRIEGQGPVYVNGNVYMKGNSTLTNGSNLVVSGNFKQVGNTLDEVPDPVYQAEPGPLRPSPGLIVLDDDPTEAVVLTGNSTNNQYSMIYAVNGGITVNGNSKVSGALVAGGIGSRIIAKGNYTHSYPKNSVNLVKFANSPTVQSWIEM